MKRARWLAVLAAAIASATVGSPASAAPRWLPAETLAPPSATKAGGADVATDPAGNAIAVWDRVVDGIGVVEAATRPAGGPWSAGQRLSTPARSARSPRVAVDARGDAVVVWAQDGPEGTAIRHRTRRAGEDFSPSSPLSESEPGRAALEPRVAISPGGAAIVAWSRELAGQTVVEAAVRDAAGSRFGLPARLSDPAATAKASAVEVALSPSGDAVAVWVQDASPPRIDAAVRPSGTPWQAFRTLDSGGTVMTGPDVAVGATGRVYAAWRVDSGTIRASARETVGGAWSPAAPVATQSLLDVPRVIVGADGTPVVVYAPRYGGASAILALTGSGLAPLSTVEFRLFEPYDVVQGPDGTAIAHWVGQGTLLSSVRPPGGSFGAPLEIGRLATGTRGLAIDGEANAVALWQQEHADGTFSVRAAGFDAAPPVLSAVEVPVSAPAGVPIEVSAIAADRWSPTTLSWAFSDGASATGASASHAFAAPGTAQVTVTARDAQGNETSATRTVEIVAPPPVRRVDPDADGDGVPASLDCRDADPAISPTRAEVPGNGVDENCDGTAEPYPRVQATATLTTAFERDRRTRLLRLAIADAASGDTIRIRCTGAGCVKRMNRTVEVRRATRRLQLTRYVQGVRLKPKARVEVRISHPGQVARIFTFVMRASRSGAPQRTRQCLVPGQSKATSC